MQKFQNLEKCIMTNFKSCSAKYKNCRTCKNCTRDKITNIAKMSQAEKNAELAKISYEASAKQVVYNKEDLVFSKIASLAKTELGKLQKAL